MVQNHIQVMASISKIGIYDNGHEWCAVKYSIYDDIQSQYGGILNGDVTNHNK